MPSRPEKLIIPRATPLRGPVSTATYKRSALGARFCIALSCIAFVTGHIAFSAAGALQSSQQQKSESPSIPEKTEKIKFKLTRIGNGKSDDGTWWTTYDLMTSDDHALSMQWFPFSTLGRANKQFKLFLKHASKVIQHGPEVDEKGKTIGKRVLAFFAEDEKGKTNYRLFWTSETRFCQIAGEHVDDLLVLESRLKEKSLLEITEESKLEAAH